MSHQSELIALLHIPAARTAAQVSSLRLKCTAASQGINSPTCQKYSSSPLPVAGSQHPPESDPSYCYSWENTRNCPNGTHKQNAANADV